MRLLPDRNDPITKKRNQLQQLSHIGKQLNAKGHWKLSLDITRFGDQATVCLFRTADTSGQAIVQTTVDIRPQTPLENETEHESFNRHVDEHLSGLLVLVKQLTGAELPDIDPVAEQEKWIGVFPYVPKRN